MWFRSRRRRPKRADNLERSRWFFARAQGELLPPAHPQRLERLNDWTTDFLWRSRDKSARVCICLVLLVSCCICHLNCSIIIRCAKNGFRKCPRNDDLLVGRPRVPPSAK